MIVTRFGHQSHSIVFLSKMMSLMGDHHDIIHCRKSFSIFAENFLDLPSPRNLIVHCEKSYIICPVLVKYCIVVRLLYIFVKIKLSVTTQIFKTILKQKFYSIFESFPPLDVIV